MQKDKREDYEKFWAAFGRQIKYGAYVEYGAHKELLQDLLMYHPPRRTSWYRSRSTLPA